MEKLCPLKNIQCVKSDCKWWTEEHTLNPDCAIFEIIHTLYQIKARLIFIDDDLRALKPPGE